jgi:hypothetical protein
VLGRELVQRKHGGEVPGGLRGNVRGRIEPAGRSDLQHEGFAGRRDTADVDVDLGELARFEKLSPLPVIQWTS